MEGQDKGNDGRKEDGRKGINNGKKESLMHKNEMHGLKADVDSCPTLTFEPFSVEH